MRFQNVTISKTLFCETVAPKTTGPESSPRAPGARSPRASNKWSAITSTVTDPDTARMDSSYQIVIHSNVASYWRTFSRRLMFSCLATSGARPRHVPRARRRWILPGGCLLFGRIRTHRWLALRRGALREHRRISTSAQACPTFSSTCCSRAQTRDRQTRSRRKSRTSADTSTLTLPLIAQFSGSTCQKAASPRRSIFWLMR